ncbi:MAG: hypothetical protein QOH70_2248 [Blastocatellia bacterium]|nr:hypothetical protein [Blastocatellia bacterium]
MHLQLVNLADKFDLASDLVRHLVDGLSIEQLTLQLDPRQWCIAACLVHLNLSSETFLTVIAHASDDAHRNGVVGGGPYKMDLRGRAVRWILRPPAQVKFSTNSALEPSIIGPIENILPRFLTLQRELQNSIEQVDGLDLNRIVVLSPFSKHVRYNLYSCFEVIQAHQLRHVWQAEHVKREILGNR